MDRSVAALIPMGSQKFASILAIKHGKKPELPGGKVEANEDLLRAVRREAFEEVGLMVSEAVPFYEAECFGRHCTVFLCVAHGKLIGSIEGRATRTSRDDLIATSYYRHFYVEMFRVYEKLASA